MADEKQTSGEQHQDGYYPPKHHWLHAGYSHKVLQQWQREATIEAVNMVYPIFVTDVPDQKEEIKSMPNQYRWGVKRLDELMAPLVKKGLKSVLIFGVLTNDKNKSRKGDFATSDKSPAVQAIQHIHKTYPDVLVMADLCLCAYTDHGHCFIPNDDNSMDNETSINYLAEVAVVYAKAGASVIAPSDMMDGRIGAIKHALKKARLQSTVSVMSYAAKFASVLYGPFRDAAASGAKFGDRTKYQLPVNARGLALRAVDRDVEEGADMVMVKPGGMYLDIVRDIKNTYHMPIAIYQVSGEYAMLYHAAKAGAFDMQAAVMESLGAMQRAGANILISYFTPDVLQWLADKKQ